MLQYVAALVLIGHGVGHLTGVLGSWTEINPGFSDKPWVLPGDYALDSTVGKAWATFWIVALMLFLASGIGVFMEEQWWRTVALLGSVFSMVAILPWARTVVVGALAGVALDVAIILVLLLPWGDKVAEFFEVP